MQIIIGIILFSIVIINYEFFIIVLICLLMAYLTYYHYKGFNDSVEKEEYKNIIIGGITLIVVLFCIGSCLNDPSSSKSTSITNESKTEIAFFIKPPPIINTLNILT